MSVTSPPRPPGSRSASSHLPGLPPPAGFLGPSNPFPFRGYVYQDRGELPFSGALVHSMRVRVPACVARSAPVNSHTFCTDRSDGSLATARRQRREGPRPGAPAPAEGGRAAGRRGRTAGRGLGAVGRFRVQIRRGGRHLPPVGWRRAQPRPAPRRRRRRSPEQLERGRLHPPGRGPRPVHPAKPPPPPVHPAAAAPPPRARRAGGRPAHTQASAR